MNKQLPFVLLLIPLFLSANASLGQVNFQTGDLELLQKNAAREGKLLFVNFTASWCMPCQWMEKNTFLDKQLGDFLNRHYLPVKIDIDGKSGYEQKEKYRITLLPTMLIIDERGVVIARYEESMPPGRLYQVVQQSYQRQFGIRPAQAVLEAPPRPDLPIFRPALIPEKPIARPSVAPHTEYASLPTAPAGTDSESIQLNTRKNFGIQVAVYSSYDNAVRHMNELDRRFRQPVNIFVSEQQGRQKLYRILIGVFDTLRSADQYASQLQKQNINGIIKDLSTL
jgi:thioredoxin-related protein